MGNVYSYLCRFLPFQSFFFLFLCFFRFFFFLFSLLAGSLLHFFFFLLRPLASRLLHPSIHSYFFFHQVFFHPGQRRHCETLPLTPPHYLSLLTMSSSLLAGDQLVVRGGNAHFFTYTRIRSRETGENRKTNEQTRTSLGLPRAEEGMQHYMHVHSW